MPLGPETESTEVQTEVSLLGVAEDVLRDVWKAVETSTPLVPKAVAGPSYAVTFKAADPFGHAMHEYLYDIGQHVGLSEQGFECWKCQASIIIAKKTAM
jgi:hypothetical protein